ncbi:hypothetical protein MBANPS3_008290 [Mucor bainieri]
MDAYILEQLEEARRIWRSERDQRRQGYSDLDDRQNMQDHRDQQKEWACRSIYQKYFTKFNEFIDEYCMMCSFREQRRVAKHANNRKCPLVATTDHCSQCWSLKQYSHCKRQCIVQKTIEDERPHLLDVYLNTDHIQICNWIYHERYNDVQMDTQDSWQIRGV